MRSTNFDNREHVLLPNFLSFHIGPYLGTDVIVLLKVLSSTLNLPSLLQNVTSSLDFRSFNDAMLTADFRVEFNMKLLKNGEY